MKKINRLKKINNQNLRPLRPIKGDIMLSKVLDREQHAQIYYCIRTRITRLELDIIWEAEVRKQQLVMCDSRCLKKTTVLAIQGNRNKMMA